MHAFFRSNRPLVFAHRGGSGLGPENTLAAFDRGIAAGADGLELDVHLSRDAVVVVHHDRRLERTTNLRGFVADRTADELASADAGWHFRRGHEFPFRGKDIGVPTLAQVLGRYPEIRIIVELKVNRPDFARAALEVVREAGAIDRVCFGSSAFRVLRAARALEPAIATSAARQEVRWALYRSWWHLPLWRVPYDGFQVPEMSGRTRVVSPRFVRAAHRAGLGVQTWAVDTEDDARRLLDWGADALITDRPDIVVPVRDAICTHRR